MRLVEKAAAAAARNARRVVMDWLPPRHRQAATAPGRRKRFYQIGQRPDSAAGN
jgi:hypothetical protein